MVHLDSYFLGAEWLSKPYYVEYLVTTLHVLMLLCVPIPARVKEQGVASNRQLALKHFQTFIIRVKRTW